MTAEQRKARREHQAQYNHNHPTISVRTDPVRLARWRQEAAAAGLSVGELVALAVDHVNLPDAQVSYRRGSGAGYVSALAYAYAYMQVGFSWEDFWQSLDPEDRRQARAEAMDLYGAV